MVTKIFEAVSQVITGMTTAITSALNGVVGIFWDTTSATPQLTSIGTLCIIGFGTGLVFFALKKLFSLVKVK